MNTTKTVNRMHFSDLSHERFEDLCVQYTYNLKSWKTIQHFGRKGKDGGIDIYGEFFDEGALKTWVIQCKRYKNITKNKLEKIIDDFINKNLSLPDRYVLLLACDISRTSYEQFKKYANEKGLDVNVITASILEAELYARHPDILYTFFGLQSNNKRSSTVVNVKRRISLKKKIMESMMRYRNDGNTCSEVIIQDIHRDTYPESNFSMPGISPWFRLEYFKPYFKGISFLLGCVNVFIEENTGIWKLSEEIEPPAGWRRITAYEIGNIPFDNIVDIDIDGDEYYNVPHFYCEFNNLGEPYEEIWYDPTPNYKNTIITLSRESKC